jgi:hypothetical protein
LARAIRLKDYKGGLNLESLVVFITQKTALKAKGAKKAKDSSAVPMLTDSTFASSIGSDKDALVDVESIGLGSLLITGIGCGFSCLISTGLVSATVLTGVATCTGSRRLSPMLRTLPRTSSFMVVMHTLTLSPAAAADYTDLTIVNRSFGKLPAELELVRAIMDAQSLLACDMEEKFAMAAEVIVRKETEKLQEKVLRNLQDTRRFNQVLGEHDYVEKFEQIILDSWTEEERKLEIEDMTCFVLIVLIAVVIVAMIGLACYNDPELREEVYLLFAGENE